MNPKSRLSLRKTFHFEPGNNKKITFALEEEPKKPLPKKKSVDISETPKQPRSKLADLDLYAVSIAQLYLN